MKWEMEIDEIEAVLEKIWDLHDKLSDAIHSISRTHFLNSIKALKKTDKNKLYNDVVEDNRAGFVFVKGFRVDDNESASAIQEAKSLNAIRTALENLEDQLEALRLKASRIWLEGTTDDVVINPCTETVQTNQRAEKDAAIARLEQSRIVLAMRLSEHHGKKHKVIEEALAFVGDVQDAARFISPDNLYGSPVSPSGQNFAAPEGRMCNGLIHALISSFDFAKKTLKLDQVGGILSNAAIVAVSMIALLHLHQAAYKEHPQKQDERVYSNRAVRKTTQLESSSPNTQLNQLDVMSARG
ncbi:Plastid division protein PDV1 [Citrus sinensis]|nr:Plastid division protein PDV1 [Citrus sinensis]